MLTKENCKNRVRVLSDDLTVTITVPSPSRLPDEAVAASANKLLQMADAGRELLRRLQDAEAVPSIVFAREELVQTLSKDAHRLKVSCLSALLAAGPAVAKHYQLLDRLRFVGTYFPLPRSPLTCPTPVAADLLAAIEILEAAASVVRPTATAPAAQVGAAPRFRASDWTQVNITFFNEHSVKITVPDSEQNHDYATLGLADGRSKNGKPVGAWTVLHGLAKTGGVIQAQRTTAAWPMLEKQVQHLRKWLRQNFGIDAEPLPFVRGTGYRAAFNVQLSPSYRQ